MKPARSAVLVGVWQKRILYGITALLWASGSAWLYLRYFGQTQTAFGLQASPLQPLWMRIHGAAAMLFLMSFGAFLLQHVPAGWNEKRQRPSGVSLVSFCGILAVTGWGLYYLVDAGTRRWVSVIHWSLGLAFPAIIALHVILRNTSPSPFSGEGGRRPGEGPWRGQRYPFLRPSPEKGEGERPE